MTGNEGKAYFYDAYVKSALELIEKYLYEQYEKEVQ